MIPMHIDAAVVIARFEPTRKGLALAKLVAKQISIKMD